MHKWMSIIMSAVLLLIIVIPIHSLADEGGEDNEEQPRTSEIDISLSPSDVLFDITNMKPGDWAPRTIIVQNSGILDFSYQMELRNDGSQKLFNELMMEITDVEGELYNGKLAEFDVLPIRDIEAGKEEELTITIRFPEHLGNEFQGTNSAFAFLFTAEGAEQADSSDKDEQIVEGAVSGGDGSSGGLSLPETATNIFNVLILGGIFLVIGFLILLLNRRRVTDRS
ncbi:TasA family protein [Oceanobacillus massiliensis]|uniref:TasA family protein n=1 Tax=Oceanobacillus massiliensis TaxID=1465765 RepID=UPI0006782ACB|nr:TasA family protein [Oceanobacillus massiliensis]